MPDADARRSEIQEEIHQLLNEYARSWEGNEETTVVSWYIVGELVWPTSTSRTLLEIGDAHSSHFTAVGLLYTALHDPRWLPVREDAE